MKRFVIALALVWCAALQALAASLTVYPAQGLTVYAADSVTVIPTSGAIVDDVPYYRDLLRRGKLLTYDPLNTGGDPIEILFATVGANSTTTAQLIGREIRQDGQLVTTTGKETAGDGGGGIFRGAIASSQASDGISVLSASNGRWVRVDNRECVSIRLLGCKDDGVTTCGAKINAYLQAIATGRVNNFACLFVPPVDYPGPGYRLEVPISPPNALRLTVRGEGVPNCEAVNPGDSTAAKTRSGSVLLPDANVSAFAATNGQNYVFLDLQNLLILGPGSDLTTGHGVDANAAANFQFTSSNLWTYGLDHGVFLKNTISGRGHFQPFAKGNKVGWQLGNVATGPFDQQLWGPNIEGNRQGLIVETCRNVLIVGGLIQGNEEGMILGNSAGTGAVQYFTMVGPFHFENNGETDVYGPLVNVGKRHIKIFATAGNAYSEVVLRNVGLQGILSQADKALRVDLPAGSWTLDGCLLGNLYVADNTSVDLRGPGVTAGAATLNVSSLAKVTRTARIFPEVYTSASGTYTHNWGASGDAAHLALSGNLTIAVPTNAQAGARVRYLLKQLAGDGVSTYTVNFSSDIKLNGAWSAAGVAWDKVAMIELQALTKTGGGLGWYEVGRTPWIGPLTLAVPARSETRIACDVIPLRRERWADVPRKAVAA